MASPKDLLDNSQYVISRETEINLLDCKTAFSGLTIREKLYSHYLCRASWDGALICLLQTSPESPGIFLLLQCLFHAETIEELKGRALSSQDGPSEDDFEVISIREALLWLGGQNDRSTIFFEAAIQAKLKQGCALRKKIISSSQLYQLPNLPARVPRSKS